MAISAEKIRELIKKKFPQADIEIVDTAGDSNHYSATVTAQEFNPHVLSENAGQLAWPSDGLPAPTPCLNPASCRFELV